MASFRFAVLARHSCFTDCVMVLFFIIDNWWKQGLSLLETLDQMSFREKIPCTRNFGWITPQKFGWKITKLPQNSHLVHAFNSVNRDSLVSIILNQFLDKFDRIRRICWVTVSLLSAIKQLEIITTVSFLVAYHR